MASNLLAMASTEHSVLTLRYYYYVIHRGASLRLVPRRWSHVKAEAHGTTGPASIATAPFADLLVAHRAGDHALGLAHLV